MTASIPRPALFVDRDGTIIADAHYPSHAAQVRLLRGAAAAIARANAAQVPVVVVTNQSGIGRGMISQAQYEDVRARIDDLLVSAGARIDATYHCPHWPSLHGPCDCRKPGLGMYQRAAEDLDLTLHASAYIGDRWRDVQPARDTGGIGILVPGPETPEEDLDTTRVHLCDTIRIAESIDDAITMGLAFAAESASTSTDSR